MTKGDRMFVTPAKGVRRLVTQNDATPPPKTDRMRIACAKARESFAAVARRARRLSEELDEAAEMAATSTSVELHDEDSAVVAVREMIGSLATAK